MIHLKKVNGNWVPPIRIRDKIRGMPWAWSRAMRDRVVLNKRQWHRIMLLRDTCAREKRKRYSMSAELWRKHQATQAERDAFALDIYKQILENWLIS